jgi:hypothetical protein
MAASFWPFSGPGTHRSGKAWSMPSLRPVRWLGLLALLGCPPAVPGELVGTFDVVMHLEENGCGEGAVYVTDGESFAAELRTDGPKAYWRVPEQPMIDGYEQSGEYRFAARSIVDSSDADAGPVCQIVQTAELIVKVHAAPPDGGAGDGSADAAPEAGTGLVLEGAYTLTLDTAPGTDCSAAISPRGVFKSLPCTVRYDFSGTEREPLD